MSIFSKLLFGLVLLLVHIGFAPAPLANQLPPENCAERPHDKGRLWKITKGEAVPSYIFGTMHSTDPRILHLPGVIMQVFIAANTAVFETSLKDDELARNQRMMLLSPEQSLKKKIGEARFNDLSRIAAAYGMSPATLDRIKIWAAAAVISQPPPDPQSGGNSLTLLDKELEKSARQSGKRVTALESNAEQLAIFDSMSDAVQLEYLDQAIDENHRLNEELETMTSYYLSGNTGWIVCDLEETLRETSAALSKTMTTDLIYMRNHRMVERMLPELQRGNAFIAIGALHLPGEEGVLSLLEKLNYKIERKY